MSPAELAGWIIAGILGAALLIAVLWVASVVAWQRRRDVPDDVAPGTALPSLYELRDRRDRR